MNFRRLYLGMADPIRSLSQDLLTYTGRVNYSTS